MSFKQYTFTFASGATGTNKMYVNPHSKMHLIVSNPTSFQAAAGNSAYFIRGGLSLTDTHGPIASCTVTTETAKGIYFMPTNGVPFMSIGFGTAVCGTAANTIDLVVYNEVGS